jgi:hypothetical protein
MKVKTRSWSEEDKRGNAKARVVNGQLKFLKFRLDGELYFIKSSDSLYYLQQIVCDVTSFLHKGGVDTAPLRKRKLRIVSQDIEIESKK